MKIFLLILIFSVQTYSQSNSEYPRFTYDQMTNKASRTRLSHRIFYRPSQGINAKWFDAVKKGDLPLMKKMISQGQNIEVKDTASLGQTALLWASFLGYIDIVKYLVEEEKANLFATDRADVQHAFKSAILGGDITTIKYLYNLLKDKIDLNSQDERDGETMLMVAVGNDRVDAVKFLLNLGVDVNIVSKQLDRNAMSYACVSRNKKLEKMLIEAGAKYYKNNSCR